MIAKVHTDNEEGVIPANSQVILKVTLTTLVILDPVLLELGIKIMANEDKPLIVKITANSTGPKVDVKLPMLDFGELNVLKEASKFLPIVNNSNIKADFFAFTK